MIITPNSLQKMIKSYLNEAKIKKYTIIADLKSLDPPDDQQEVSVGITPITDCSKWARKTVKGKKQFNAWLGYTNGIKIASKVKWPGPQSWVKAADLFTRINKDYDNYKSYNDECKDLLQSIYDNSGISNNSFKDYGVGTAVGLYYLDSGYHAHSFYGASTGRVKMGGGARISYGPYFVVKEDTSSYKEGDLWEPAMIGKDISFKPNVKLIKQHGGFCFNTHMGLIGAKNEDTGEAIIYHNISGKIKAVPVSKSNNCLIMWAGVWPKPPLKTARI